MNKKIIAIDIDDVLADTTESLRHVVNRKTGANLTSEHYKIKGQYWGYYESVWSKHGLEDQVNFKSIRDMLAIEDQENIEVVQGAKTSIKKLSKNYNLVALTSRPTAWRQLSIDWINANFPNMFWRVEFVHHDENDSRTKGEVCAELGASWLIDDSVDYGLSAIDKKLKVVLFGEYGWNMHRKLPAGMVRVKNWQEVLEYFENES